MNIIYLVVTFIASFTTMAYAMILSSTVSDFTGEEVLSQCLTIGPYLLGLGIGSLIGEKESKDLALTKLIRLEWLSSWVLPLIPLLQTIFVFVLINSHWSDNIIDQERDLKYVLSFASILSILTGLLGGSQLPLIFKLAGHKISSEIIIGVNYLGPLFSGPVIVLFNNLAFESYKQVGIISLIQICGISLLISLSENRVTSMLKLSFPILLIIYFPQIYPKAEFLTIKSIYLKSKIDFANLDSIKNGIRLLENYGNLERVKTPYQVIDFFTTQTHPEIETEEESILYLNRKTQFSEIVIAPYHESMLYAGLNLYKGMPQNYLILGGGDGILLNEIKKNNPKANVTMVELDSGIVEWSKNNPIISRYNNHTFSKYDPKTKIIFDDAITYLRQYNSENKFDLILIDFPFPNGHELSKLYSKEFYLLVKKVLHKESVVIIDMPLQKENNGELTRTTNIILKTLHDSGYLSKLPFGPILSFVALKQNNETLEFNYQKLPSHLHLSTKLNLKRHISEEDIDNAIRKESPNSMFRPNL
jgi:spermidine synthase